VSDAANYPSLAKPDDGLLEDLFALLSKRVHGNPYSEDGSFAAEIRALPIGLRAMAATHYLDVSLTLDDIGWHFLNFGEANLVRETEFGLRELGLMDLARWFSEVYDTVLLFLQAFAEGDFSTRLESGKSQGDVYYEWLDETGHRMRIDELSKLAWAMDDGIGDQAKGSAIYQAWIRYARMKPGNVFPDVQPA
jgi:hypothetical protein